MLNMKKALFLMIFACMASSCSGAKTVDVKSPCVSASDGPCGPRKPVNDWLDAVS